MMKVLYRYMIAPLAVLIYLVLVVPFFKKPRRLFALRRERRKDRPSTSGDWIWIHASSGEFEYAKAIIRELKQRTPELKILVTYSSPSYEKQIRAFEYVDHSEPLPLDIPGPMSQFIRKFKPKILLIARTDLWPELLWQCRANGVKTLIFALAFPRPLSFLEKRWKSWILSQLDHLFVISASDVKIAAKELQITTKIDSVGDPRFDQAIYRIANTAPPDIKRSERPILVAGSTWPEDEKVILPALLPMIESGRLALIIAPHEPSEAALEGIKTYFKSTAIGVELYSDHPKGEAEVIIVDRVGVLAGLYPIADIAFVGGSFKAKVHSVMEPLVAGLPVLVGPHHQNNSEAVRFQKVEILGSINAVMPVQTTEKFKAAVEQLIADPSQFPRFKNKITEVTREELGASQKIVNHLLGPDYLGGPDNEHLPSHP